MKCDNCKTEDPWLEIIGQNVICKKCINKHKDMGLIYRTHMDTFHFLIKRMKPLNYESYMQIIRKQIESSADLKMAGIRFKTTNVISLE